jgi:hypothetical protein
MKVFAASMNTPTPAFLAAVAGLTEAGHRVDFFKHRSGNESYRDYRGALISLGDFTTPDAMPIKLALVRAVMEVPTCFFLDRPPYQGAAEKFWASALFADTTGAALHRSEMIVAARDWRQRIERVLKLFASKGLSESGVVPAHSSMAEDGCWDPTPFYSVPSIPTAKDRSMITISDDSPPYKDLARANVAVRSRNGKDSSSLWFPMAVACAKLRTVYCDREYNPTLRFDEAKARSLTPMDRERIVDEQSAAVMSGVPGAEQSAQQLDKLFTDIVRKSKPIM